MRLKGYLRVKGTDLCESDTTLELLAKSENFNILRHSIGLSKCVYHIVAYLISQPFYLKSKSGVPLAFSSYRDAGRYLDRYLHNRPFSTVGRIDA